MFSLAFLHVVTAKFCNSPERLGLLQLSTVLQMRKLGLRAINDLTRVHSQVEVQKGFFFLLGCWPQWVP